MTVPCSFGCGANNRWKIGTRKKKMKARLIGSFEFIAVMTYITTAIYIIVKTR